MKIFDLNFDVEEDPIPDGEEHDLLENVMDGEEVHDSPREKVKTEKEYYRSYVRSTQWGQKLIRTENKGFNVFYSSVAVVSCVLLIGMLLFTISYLPRYGVENPESALVVKRYVENGLQETGAVNIVSGIILDYRAFDTLGESHVLFTALMCVTVLLLRDSKNMRTQYEDFYTIRDEKYHELYRESIMKMVAAVLLPCLFLYGAYVLLNGQISPGGGFSGGAVLGSGLIICAAAFGFRSTDRVITKRTANLIAFFSLGFYSFAKGYVFFTGANGLENHIPKGTPERRPDPSAGYCGGSCGGNHDVRFLQSVPQGQHRRKQVMENLIANSTEAVAVILFGIGFTMLLFHRNLFRKLIGLNVMDTGVFLFLASMGYIEGRKAPIIVNGVQSTEAYINPLPASLVLTGIVVSVSVTAIMLSLTVRLYMRYHTLNLDEIYRMADHLEDDR